MVVHSGVPYMVDEISKSKSVGSTRTSISFPRALYSDLERIAASKKVSLAWVVREAVEKYVADQWPLFASVKNEKESQH